MKIFLTLISFTLCCYCGICVQPYFPPQIVFSPGDDQILMAIDQINQRAYITYPITPSLIESAFVMKHFPFAVPGTPQSKYYVQLANLSTPNSCIYGTYWKYGGDMLNFFPTHWLDKKTFEIKNYMNYTYEMIHSNTSRFDEDYWYSNSTCQVTSGEIYPCQEIYFKKDTDIPLRSTEVHRAEWKIIQETTNYIIKSIGKPDDKYFNSISNDWFATCRDADLGVMYNPQTIFPHVDESINVQVWLSTPPHRINGNDTVRIQWNATEYDDCFTWTPKELSFNGNNFQHKQIITITRVKKSDPIYLLPIFNGGGFDLVTPDTYPINIQ